MTKIHIQPIADLLSHTAQAVEGASREFFALPENEFDIAHDEFKRWCVCHALGLVNKVSIRGHDKSIQSFLYAWRSIEVFYINTFSALVMNGHLQAFHGMRVQVIVTDNDLIIAG